ncbi:hypothetical protein AOQ84DRAFT_350930 [Glonium stellatum]|uniref:Fe2OG dioxygenase domain-containing protein n=1 Tax=Glonium stellatum TaxID=574774 RepID=A0A8E2EMK7_9PEZI|nr:hypothetical protein AOQ84DRAFT_350930 [Glonium stellatum]
MDAFISRKRRRISDQESDSKQVQAPETRNDTPDDDESTDFKLALLASLQPDHDEETLLEALLISEGSVKKACKVLNYKDPTVSPRKNAIGYQSSLSSFNIKRDRMGDSKARDKKLLTKKGRTLHLYSPEDIEKHTPCSIIHNFLPLEEANALLLELLKESPTFRRDTFKLFDRVVQSPHTMGFYVDTLDEAELHRTEYVYNGNYVEDVRQTLPEMRKVSVKVQATVNEEIQRRIRMHYPEGKKLKYQSPHPWKPNTAFVNCYDGGTESVGYHTDHLTYLGPHAVIGSLSLGVAREFRVRKIVPRDQNDGESNSTDKKIDESRADAEGQISIHLPHNSLLVMHAEMQEEWKHSIAPAQAIDPHPIAKNKRINITYRQFKDSLNPRLTPKCHCKVPTSLRCVQRSKENKGRYMWQCDVSYAPGKDGCSFFQWAEFDDDGEPPWVKKPQEEKARSV